MDFNKKRFIQLPYEIGDTVYYLQRRESYENHLGFYVLANGDRVTVSKMKVEHIVIGESGCRICDNTWDGFVPIETYSKNHPYESYSNESIFNTSEEVMRYIELLSKDGSLDYNRKF